ncbi:MAG: hypothetical protein ACHQIM_17655 [Sphingobacteriales bacterium]
MEDKNKSEIFLNAKKSLPTNGTPPEWQVALGKKELQNIADSNTELIEWSEAKKQFK